MEELDIGQATIVYEDPEEGRTETTVDNEQLVYGRDHWMVRTGTDDRGNDLLKQIPRSRVHYVDRNVERFEEEARTVRHRVESIASDLRRKLPVGDGKPVRSESDTEPRRIPVERGEESGLNDDRDR